VFEQGRGRKTHQINRAGGENCPYATHKNRTTETIVGRRVCLGVTGTTKEEVNLSSGRRPRRDPSGSLYCVVAELWVCGGCFAREVRGGPTKGRGRTKTNRGDRGIWRRKRARSNPKEGGPSLAKKGGRSERQGVQEHSWGREGEAAQKPNV